MSLIRGPGRRVRRKMQGYLFHIGPAFEGITHWFVAARDLEEAWKTARELPCLTALDKPGVAQPSVFLGRVFSDETWHLFERNSLKQLCTHCTPTERILWENEVNDFRRLRELQLAEAHLHGRGIE